MSEESKTRCTYDTMAYACGRDALETVYVEFNRWAVEYPVCMPHYRAAEQGESMTFRSRDRKLLLGYAAGIVKTHTDLPIRAEDTCEAFFG